MHRTTVMLPEELKIRAVRRARMKRISLGELIRISLEEELKSHDTADGEDTMFMDDAVYRGSAPKDLAENHDKYLYESE